MLGRQEKHGRIGSCEELFLNTMFPEPLAGGERTERNRTEKVSFCELFMTAASSILLFYR